MAVAAVEVNDAGLVIVDERADAKATSGSPGYALLDGETVVLGAEAERRARLNPRFVHSRFWDQLDSSPLPRPFPEHLSRADLAHAHLDSVWKAARPGVDCVLLAVPGWYSSRQLAQLLGIARACAMPVSGLVDAAVAAAVAGYPGEKLLHVDVQLHRAVLTELLQGPELLRGRVEVAPGAGLIALRDAWAKGIAALFVRRTRFDPLHDAPTEQELYDRLPGWLGELNDSQKTVPVMAAGDREHSVELTLERALADVETMYERLAQLVGALKRVGEPVTLLLSHRAAALPGLAARLSGFREVTLTVLPPGASGSGALTERGRIRASGEALPFVTRLPRASDVPQAPGGHRPALAAPERGHVLETPLRAQAPGPAPTHLLHEGQAFRITTRPFTLGVAAPAGGNGLRLTGTTTGISRRHCTVQLEHERVLVEDHSTYGSFVNDERVEGRAELVAGDRLRLGSPGIELQLIRLAESDGTAQD